VSDSLRAAGDTPPYSSDCLCTRRRSMNTGETPLITSAVSSYAGSRITAHGVSYWAAERPTYRARSMAASESPMCLFYRLRANCCRPVPYRDWRCNGSRQSCSLRTHELSEAAPVSSKGLLSFWVAAPCRRLAPTHLSGADHYSPVRVHAHITQSNGFYTNGCNSPLCNNLRAL